MKKTLTIALLALAAHAHAADPTFSAITITGTAALPATTTVSGTALGGAAWLNTGTAAGTVAAGDDSRIVNAVQVGGTTTNLTATGSLTVNGNTTLGDAIGDTLTINAGTVTAPNATGTTSSSVANVGTLDGRYPRVFRAVLESAVNLTSSTYTTLFSLTLPVGRYSVQGQISVYGGATNSGQKRRIVGGTATLLPGRGLISAVSNNTFSPVSDVLGEQSASYSGTSIGWITGYASVSTAGTVVVEIAQNVTDATNPSQVQAGSYIIFTKLN